MLRALRICSKEYLEEEFKHITDAFTKLAYPKALILKYKHKAIMINERSNSEREKRSNERANIRYVTVPNSMEVSKISHFLRNTNINIVTETSRKIEDIIKNRTQKPKQEDSIVYKIPCGECSQSYIGETRRGLKTRISEHKRDVQHHRTSNALVIHIDKESHLPDWSNAVVLNKGLTRKRRKTRESAYICTENCINTRSGNQTLSKTMALTALKRLITLREPHSRTNENQTNIRTRTEDIPRPPETDRMTTRLRARLENVERSSNYQPTG